MSEDRLMTMEFQLGLKIAGEKNVGEPKSLFELSVLQKWSIGSLFYSRSPWDRAPWIRRDTSCRTHSTLPLHNNSTNCRVCRNKLHEFSPTNLNSAHYSLREIIFKVVGIALTPNVPRDSSNEKSSYKKQYFWWNKFRNDLSCMGTILKTVSLLTKGFYKKTMYPRILTDN